MEAVKGNTSQQQLGQHLSTAVRAHSVGILTSGRKYNGLNGHHPTRGTSWKNALITTRSEDGSVSARSTGSNDESAEKSSCAQAKPTHEDGTTERTNDASIRFFLFFTVYDTSLAGGKKTSLHQFGIYRVTRSDISPMTRVMKVNTSLQKLASKGNQF